MDEILASIRKIIADGPGLETPKPNSPDRNFSQVSDSHSSRGPGGERAVNGEAVAVADPLSVGAVSEHEQSSHRVTLGFVDHGAHGAVHTLRQDGHSHNGLGGQPQGSPAGLGPLPGPGQSLEDDLVGLLEEQQSADRNAGWAMQLPVDDSAAGLIDPPEDGASEIADEHSAHDQAASADHDDESMQSIDDISVEEALKAIDAQIAAGQALDEGSASRNGSEQLGVTDEFAADPSPADTTDSDPTPDVDRSRAEQLLLGTLKGSTNAGDAAPVEAVKIEDLLDDEMRTERHDAPAEDRSSEGASGHNHELPVSDGSSGENSLNNVEGDTGTEWLTIKPEAEAAEGAGKFVAPDKPAVKDDFPMASLVKPFGLSGASATGHTSGRPEAVDSVMSEQPEETDNDALEQALSTLHTATGDVGAGEIDVEPEAAQKPQTSDVRHDVLEELVGVPESDVVSPLGALAAGLAASARKPLLEEAWADDQSHTGEDTTDPVAGEVRADNAQASKSAPVFEAAEISEVIEPSGKLLLAAAHSGVLQPLSGGPTTRSLEDAVSEMLRPLLREWLETNMPRIVENALRIEVAEGLHGMQADNSPERGR